MLSRQQSATSDPVSDMSSLREARSRQSYDSATSGDSYISLSTILTDYEYLASHPDATDFEPEPRKAIDLEYGSCDLSEYGIGLEETADRAASFASFVTYISTQQSLQDPQVDRPGSFPFYRPDSIVDDAIPTTPSDFGKLFPSARKLCISHDAGAADGNMNLKVKTDVRFTSGIQQVMTLFHLRLYDLNTREFSLRRYDRNSGREVCHSVRKFHRPSDTPRPGLQRKLRKAFAHLRTNSDTRMSNYSTGRWGGSIESVDSVAESRPKTAGQDSRPGSTYCAPESIKLEFSNYAHVEVRQRGTGMYARYDLEYWGLHYSWRRMILKDGKDEQICYHLTRAGDHEVLAKIMPEPIGPIEQQREEDQGAWIAPHAMWISDEGLLGRADVCDVMVASGLVALVDDSFRRHFCHEEPKFGHNFPLFGRRSGLRLLQRTSENTSTVTVCCTQSGRNSPHVRTVTA